MINPVSSLFKQLDLFLSELINGNPQPNEETVKPIREKAKDQQKSSTPKKPSLPTERLMVTLEDQLVPYELQRNPRRKYLTIEISLDGNLIVRAPQTVTVEYVEQVLKTKSKWILDRLFVISNKRHSKPSDESNWDTIRDDAVLIDNDWVPIIYEKGIRRRSVSMVIRNNTIIVRIPVRQNIKEVKNWVQKQRKWIEKHYRSQKQASEERIDIREKFFRDQKISLFGKEYEIIKKTGSGRDSIKDQQITLFFDQAEINDLKVFEGKLIALLKKYARPALETRFVSISSQLPL
ncbi:MAG: M48 family metallopeptidase, partial [Parabacteroides sp.]|nr:M48 family metallopeptidase [Parabacteroides sp.]